MRRLCAVAPISLALASPGFAATLGYELTINDPIFNPVNGNFNVPDFQLTNTSAANLDITNFQLSIGDTAFNFDFVRNPSAFVDPGGDLTPTLNTVGTSNNGVGDDLLDYSFTGFNPGDVFRFEVDVDPDAGGPVQDFRDVFFPTATAFLTFSDGSTLSNVLNPADPNASTYSFGETAPAPVPLPGGLGLLLAALGIGAVALRRRDLPAPTAA